jgi:hypothetical protein
MINSTQSDLNEFEEDQPSNCYNATGRSLREHVLRLSRLYPTSIQTSRLHLAHPELDTLLTYPSSSSTSVVVSSSFVGIQSPTVIIVRDDPQKNLVHHLVNF